MSTTSNVKQTSRTLAGTQLASSLHLGEAYKKQNWWFDSHSTALICLIQTFPLPAIKR